MALLDPQGRLFGKVSLLDVGAVLVMLLVIAGIVLLPGPTGLPVVSLADNVKTVEVDAIARGLGARDAKNLITPGKPTTLIVRNQPYGQIDVKAVQFLPRTVSVPQPDGSVKALPDPRPELAYSTDMLLTLSGKARVTEKSVVLGNSNIKVGTTIELEGFKYDFNASVIDVRVLD
jgi:hypothetical protein